jgi:hypothetical protein
MLNYFANAPLVDGKEYAFKVRAICEVSAGGEALRSAWTEERTCIPGAVTEAALGGLASPPADADDGENGLCQSQGSDSSENYKGC